MLERYAYHKSDGASGLVAVVRPYYTAAGHPEGLQPSVQFSLPSQQAGGIWSEYLQSAICNLQSVILLPSNPTICSCFRFPLSTTESWCHLNSGYRQNGRCMENHSAAEIALYLKSGLRCREGLLFGGRPELFGAFVRSWWPGQRGKCSAYLANSQPVSIVITDVPVPAAFCGNHDPQILSTRVEASSSGDQFAGARVGVVEEGAHRLTAQEHRAWQRRLYYSSARLCSSRVRNPISSGPCKRADDDATTTGGRGGLSLIASPVFRVKIFKASRRRET